MNVENWLPPLISSLAVSLISFCGIIFLNLSNKNLEKIIFLWVSVAVGVILGNTFIHLIPDSFEHFAHSHVPSMLICIGIIAFFVAEKMLHWHHHQIKENTLMPLGKISLLADGIHNFTDGVIIAAAWMTDSWLGLSTTLAVCLHEIPQEIADFGILLHAGYTRKRALIWNFISALTALLGTIFMLWIGSFILNLSQYILPIAAGGFIYLACSDLIPELNKQVSKHITLVQVSMVIAGMAMMYLLSAIIKTHSH